MNNLKKLLAIIVLGLLWGSNLSANDFNGSKWKIYNGDSETIYEFLENGTCVYDNRRYNIRHKDCFWNLNNDSLTIRLTPNKIFKPVMEANINGDTLSGIGRTNGAWFELSYYRAKKYSINGALISRKQNEIPILDKYEFASKEDQYKETCEKKLNLKFGSEKYNKCVFQIMKMELELTKVVAEREIALAQAETAKAQYNLEKAKQLQNNANLKSEKFKKNVSTLVAGLLILSNLNNRPVAQQQQFKKTFFCKPTNVSTGVAAVVHCF